MGFDDLFDDIHTHHMNYREYEYHDENRQLTDSCHSYHGYGEHTKWLRIIKKIWSNRKLKVLVILAGIVFLMVLAISWIKYGKVRQNESGDNGFNLVNGII